MAADKLSLLSSTQSYLTIKDLAAAGARTKGVPEIFAGLLVFPFDTYAAAADHLLIYKAEKIEANATAVDTVLAQVNFANGDKLYWDAGNSKITNVASMNTPIGRCLKANNLSAAVPAGSVLQLELDPDLRMADRPVNGVGAGYKIARGQTTTATASDTVATGLTTVVSVVASFEDDPGDDPMLVSAKVGDQAGAPVAGSIIIKTWKNTGGTDPTPLAATTFAKKVNWIAVGT